MHTVSQSQRHSRRDLITRMSGGLLAASLGCGTNSRLTAGIPDEEIREQPLGVPHNPITSDSIPTEDLRHLLNCCIPESDMRRYPIGYVLHALRFWGSEVTFPDTRFINDEFNERGLGPSFLRCVTRNKDYLRYLSHELEEFLVESEFGVKVECSTDANWNSRFGAAHVGNLVDGCAHMGVTSATRVVTSSGAVHSLRDIVKDDAARLSYEFELEWLCCGLSRYLKKTEWLNKDGVAVSFDGMVDVLISRRGDSCMGTHVPYCLSMLLGLQDQFLLISDTTVERIRSYLRDLSVYLTDSQDGDGSWQIEGTFKRSQSFRKMNGVVDRMYLTGHHLEWMTIAPDDVRPDQKVMEDACRFLRQLLPQLSTAISSDWHVYPPATHAVRAVLRCHGLEGSDCVSALADHLS